MAGACLVQVLGRAARVIELTLVQAVDAWTAWMSRQRG
jgi:hypothetical protein